MTRDGRVARRSYLAAALAVTDGVVAPGCLTVGRGGLAGVLDRSHLVDDVDYDGRTGTLTVRFAASPTTGGRRLHVTAVRLARLGPAAEGDGSERRLPAELLADRRSPGPQFTHVLDGPQEGWYRLSVDVDTEYTRTELLDFRLAHGAGTERLELDTSAGEFTRMSENG